MFSLLPPILASLSLAGVSGHVITLVRPCSQGSATWNDGLNATSRYECAGACSDRTTCSQVQYDDLNGRCDLYTKADTSLCAEDGENERSHFYTQLFSDCQAVYDSGAVTDGVYMIQPPGAASAVPMYCSGGWTVMQRRVDGSVTFHQTRDQYRSGFGQPQGNVWLGLDTLHLLSLVGNMEMRITISGAGFSAGVRYGTFSVSGADQNYAAHFADFSTDTADLLDSMQTDDGAAFSTYDVDVDKQANNNCADMMKGGWWFGGTTYCTYQSINGVYSSMVWKIGPLFQHLTFADIRIRHT